MGCWLKCWPAIERLQFRAPQGTSFTPEMKRCSSQHPSETCKAIVPREVVIIVLFQLSC